MLKNKNYWALILGGSSGFGLASAFKLADLGFNICIIHRDRRGSMPEIEKNFDLIKSSKVELLTFNVDALKLEAINAVLRALVAKNARIRTLLHSIAFGNLKPLVVSKLDNNEQGQLVLEDQDLQQTIYAMGSSLLTWTQAVFRHGLFAEDARVLGLTSEGNSIAWPGYAAVSAAKAVLESLSRAIACEYASYGIRSNIIQAGVCPTRALSLIPGHENMLRRANERNPLGRLTRPEDIANTVALLSMDEAAWINGALIRADGGEAVAG